MATDVDDTEVMEYFLNNLMEKEITDKFLKILRSQCSDKSFNYFLGISKEDFALVHAVVPTEEQQVTGEAIEDLVCSQWYAFTKLYLHNIEEMSLDEWKGVTSLSDYHYFRNNLYKNVIVNPDIWYLKYDFMGIYEPDPTTIENEILQILHMEKPVISCSQDTYCNAREVSNYSCYHSFTYLGPEYQSDESSVSSCDEDQVEVITCCTTYAGTDLFVDHCKSFNNDVNNNEKTKVPLECTYDWVDDMNQNNDCVFVHDNEEITKGSFDQESLEMTSSIVSDSSSTSEMENVYLHHVPLVDKGEEIQFIRNLNICNSIIDSCSLVRGTMANSKNLVGQRIGNTEDKEQDAMKKKEVTFDGEMLDDSIETKVMDGKEVTFDGEM